MPALSPRDARLERAIESGLAPATGRVAVFRPTREDWFQPLDQAQLHLLTGFRPDFDALAERGRDCARAPEGRYDAALVCLPRARAAARDLIAQALACSDGPVLVDGQKADGIDGILRDCRAFGDVSEPVIKAHGKLFAIALGSSAPDDWRAEHTVATPGFVTWTGAFSADGIDPGSAALATVLPEKLPARMADLGAGWGWLSAQVLARDGVASLDLIEAEAASLDCARINLTDPRARFIWADATTFVPDAAYDAIVMNPPFHAGRAADPALGLAFIATAARLLRPQGTLWMVANRHLPYAPAIDAHFREIEELPTGAAAFRVTRARGPRAKPRAEAAAPRKVHRRPR
jgi:16S rRNA (guanine1207-N2)-methyltransferase